MFVLRPYQQEACDLAIAEMLSSSKKKGVIVAPTASGKSLYTAYIAKELLKAEPDAGILVMQPSKELLEQNYSKYIGYGGEASIFSASAGEKEIGQVTYATIGSIKGLAHMFKHVRFIIIDECHGVPPSDKPTPKNPRPKQSMYMKFIRALEEHQPKLKVVGLTATPFRMKSYSNPEAFKEYYYIDERTGERVEWKEPQKITKINLLPRERPHFFNHFIHVTQIADLYAQNYLAPLKYIAMRFDGRFLEFNSTGGEFSDESMMKAMEANDIMGKLPKMLADAYRKDRKHCLVFMRSVADAKKMSEIVPFSDYIHATTKPADRTRIIKDFKEGNIKTLFNVSVLTEGFDMPELDTIILARPTASMILYMQMIGRGIRPHPDKEYCAVVDMCDNIKRFGEIENLLIEDDPHLGWCMHNGKGKLLTGVRLDEIPRNKVRIDDNDW
jgi:DNA repair protein RadD